MTPCEYWLPLVSALRSRCKLIPQNGERTRSHEEDQQHSRRFNWPTKKVFIRSNSTYCEDTTSHSKLAAAARTYGLPTSRYLIQKRSYAVEFDSRTRNPVYVVEYLTRDNLRNVQVQRTSFGGAGNKSAKALPADESQVVNQERQDAVSDFSASAGLRSVNKETGEQIPSGQNVLLRDHFQEEEKISEKMRNKLSHFYRSGYDRGHLAAARNHRHDAEAFSETFSLANISPQVGRGFNRGYWAGLERFVAEAVLFGAAKAADGAGNKIVDELLIDEAIVITGPLFLPQEVVGRKAKDQETEAEPLAAPKTTPHRLRVEYPALGQVPNLVSVPTHYFKIVFAKDRFLACFLLPNCEIEPEIPLLFFLRSLDELEELSGVEFFPKMSPAERKALDKMELEVLKLVRTKLAILPSAEVTEVQKTEKDFSTSRRKEKDGKNAIREQENGETSTGVLSTVFRDIRRMLFSQADSDSVSGAKASVEERKTVVKFSEGLAAADKKMEDIGSNLLPATHGKFRHLCEVVRCRIRTQKPPTTSPASVDSAAGLVAASA
ncbi:unnamed protein product [Amoebophrya sp. A120]|nr:unnamed protein product [Amoebophrya sp. A120]|eukprot:GSA120T00005358001.1